MTTEAPKVEFALGSEVSPGRFFKSAFARNFTGSGRDCKSLDYELLDNVEGNEDDRDGNARNNNFFSLVNFANGDDAAARAAALWQQPKPKEVNAFCTVLQYFSFATRFSVNIALTVTTHVKYHPLRRWCCGILLYIHEEYKKRTVRY